MYSPTYASFCGQTQQGRTTPKAVLYGELPPDDAALLLDPYVRLVPRRLIARTPDTPVEVIWKLSSCSLSTMDRQPSQYNPCRWRRPP